MSLDNVKYDAFISYRHCELDSFVSENLHKKLENFKLPKSVIKKNDLKKTRIERVFRDEAELPLSDNLSDPIMAALNNSEFLIVICSPRLPLSAWCKKEVETFVATHDRKHVLLVLAEGEPDDSFPEVLLYEDVVEKDLNGNEVTIRRTREPIAADCRGKNNKERLKAMDNVVLKLCAAMFGLNYDDLKQRHREQKIKKRIIAMEVVLALVALFALVCVLFTVRIQKQNTIIQDRYASSMAAASGELYDTGRRMDAIYAARSVLPDKDNRGYNEDAYRALIEAMNVYNASEAYVPKSGVSIPSNIISFAVSPDLSKMVLSGSDDYVYACDIATGEILYSDYVEDVFDIGFLGNDTIVYSCGYYTGDEETVSVNLDDKKETLIDEHSGYIENVDNTDLTCFFTIEGYKAYRGENLLYEVRYSDYNLEFDNYFEYYDIAFSEDGKYCAFFIKEDLTVKGGILCQFETSDGTIDMFVRDKNVTDDAGLATDGEYVFVSFIDEESSLEQDCSVILRYDVSIQNTDKAISVFGEYMDSLLVNGYEVCLYGNNEVMLFSYDLEEESILTRAILIEDVFNYKEEGGFVIIDSFGQMYLLNEFYYSGADITPVMFPEKTIEKISAVQNEGDVLFIKYQKDDSYIAVYERERGEWAYALSKTPVEEFDQEYNTTYFEFLDKLKDVDKTYVRSVIESDDGKYVAVVTYNGTLTIYNARTLKVMNTVYVDYFPDYFVYLKKNKGYVLYAGERDYLFDKNFNYYASLPYGVIKGVDGNNGDLVIIDGVHDYYKVELKSYKEVIKKADEMLGDYVPEKKILDKYNISA